MKITILDTSNCDWKPIAQKFHDKNSVNICSDNWNSDVIQIVERIGSESSSAEVYKLKVGEYPEMAGKILPIISDESIRNNLNEIEIAQYLSDLNDPHFPFVYGSSYCENTIYSENSLFVEDSYRYFLYRNLITPSLSTSQKKRLLHKCRVENLDSLKSEFGDVPIGSHVLLSSLSFCDLRSFPQCFSDIVITENIWEYIIIEILKTIKLLNEDLNIMHGDLHMGNILLNVTVNNELSVPVIHDFGKSKKMDEWSMYDRITDVGTFFNDLLINPFIPEKIKNKISILNNYVDEVKFNDLSFPIMNIVQHKFLNIL